MKVQGGWEAEEIRRSWWGALGWWILEGWRGFKDKAQSRSVVYKYATRTRSRGGVQLRRGQPTITSVEGLRLFIIPCFMAY